MQELEEIVSILREPPSEWHEPHWDASKAYKWSIENLRRQQKSARKRSRARLISHLGNDTDDRCAGGATTATGNILDWLLCFRRLRKMHLIIPKCSSPASYCTIWNVLPDSTLMLPHMILVWKSENLEQCEEDSNNSWVTWKSWRPKTKSIKHTWEVLFWWFLKRWRQKKQWDTNFELHKKFIELQQIWNHLPLPFAHLHEYNFCTDFLAH